MSLKQVYSSISMNEVYYMKSVLESYEIEAVIFDEATASFAPHYLFGQNGMRLMVREEDLPRAAEVVNDYEKHKRERCDDDES